MFCTALFLFVLLFGDHALSIVSVHIEESFLLCYKTKLAAFQKKKKLTASHRLIIFTMHCSTARMSAAKRAILPSCTLAS